MGAGLKDTITESAKGPKRAKGDSGEMEQHPLPDQIAADKFLSAKEAVKKPKFGLKTARIEPPGAV